MGESYSHKYVPAGDDNRVFVRKKIASAALAPDVPYSLGLEANFAGFFRQAFKVLPVHVGGGSPTLDIQIEEWVPDPSDPFDATKGKWAIKNGIGISLGNVPNKLFEHHSEDTMQQVRLVFTPRTAVMDTEVRVELSGRRHA